MTTTPTQLPIPSEKPQDLKFNAGKIDEFATSMGWTYTDRFGVKHYTIEGLKHLAEQAISAFGYITLDSFEDGATLTLPNQILRWKSNGEYYRWDGAFPKAVALGSTPDNSGGIGNGKWLSVGAAALASTQNGAGDALVAVVQPYNGSVARTQHDKNNEFVTTFDFGMVGDGATNNSAKLAIIEALSSAPIIYGLGATYKVDAVPTSKRFSDGWWLVGTSLIPFDYTSVFRANNNIIGIGANAGASVAGARNCIAIGQDAMRYNVFGRHNICLGISAGMFLNGLNPSSIEGSRNLLIGGNSGRFMTTANRNIVLGRDAGHNITTGSLNIIIGNGAVMGDGPNTLNPGVIENQTPLTPSYTTMIGTEAGKYFNSGYSVGVGYNAAQNTKSDASLVAIGPLAFRDYQTDVSYWGTNQLIVSGAGTYSQTGTSTITIVSSGHGLTTGFRVLLRFTTGANADTTFMDDNWFVVTVIDANTFTIQSPVGATASGNITFSKVSTTTPYTGLFGGCVGVGREVGNGVSNYRSTAVGDKAGSKGLGVENTGLGYNVFLNYVAGSGSTAAGAYSQQSNNNASGNTSFGVLTMAGSVITGVSNAAFGPQAMRFVSSGANNAAFGGNALRGLTTGNYNTAVGPDALRYQSGTSTDHNYNNCVGLGYQAYVTGDNQAQIGKSDVTTYVYGTVQNRSDIRDKILNSEAPKLGIEFITGLNPVQGVWDMRDDYFEDVEVQRIDELTGLTITEFERQPIPKDGSKKRKRLHQWFIAQEVAELAQSLGIDVNELGLIQHHAVNGGQDVYSLGYDEFIPPAVRAIQQCWSRMDELEERIKFLEKK